ncbi:MAG: hypothetical protein ABI818_18770, partial [Acidobacteriota bacterium]
MRQFYRRLALKAPRPAPATSVTIDQAQSNLTNTRGSHTLRGGVDVQWAQRTAQDGTGNMGTFTYDNSSTRAADTTNVLPAQQIGLSLAAFM